MIQFMCGFRGDTMAVELYTVEDIASILKIGKTKAYKLVNTRGFPVLRLGNQLRIPSDKFENWINSYTGKTFVL